MTHKQHCVLCIDVSGSIIVYTDEAFVVDEHCHGAWQCMAICNNLEASNVPMAMVVVCQGITAVQTTANDLLQHQ